MEELKQLALELQIIFTEEQIEQFEKYYELLLLWNEKMNLTAITRKQEVIEKHFLDSLALVQVQNLEKVRCMIDIGTGAGFPGIPLKIAFPHLEITLLDSLSKRISFLEEVVASLGLNGVEMIHGRAEDWAKKSNYREQYDLGVSRAVSSLVVLSEYALPYVKIGGSFISYKGGEACKESEEAKKAVEKLGGAPPQILKFSLGKSRLERSFVQIKKSNPTPLKYPRKAGIAIKRPLQ